jgi:hypothetical protein
VENAMKVSIACKELAYVPEGSMLVVLTPEQALQLANDLRRADRRGQDAKPPLSPPGDIEVTFALQ